MPRGKIDLEVGIETLSILDENAKLDEALDPGLDDELLRTLHRAMLRARRFDERMLKLQRQGRIGTFAPIKGQEAAQIGAVAALEDEDWLVPAFRESGAALWRGAPMSGLLLYNAGYNEGGRIRAGQNDLPIAIPVASQIPHAVGIGYAMRLRGDARVALTFFGDGATSEGDFHEGLNFAAVTAAPVVFVCQNNHWAISTPTTRQTRSRTIAQKAIAYGMPGIQVDGNDVLAMVVATDEAVRRARAGDGPTLIEAVTYRMEVHTTADDPKRYRGEDEVAAWAKRDPIARFQRYLKDKGVLGDDDIDALEEEIAGEIQQAWDDAEKTMAELDDAPGEMFEHLLDTMPPELAAQREAFLAARKEGKDG